MRIIAGEKRGTIIQAPIGLDTRPTLDRVRESLFAILQFEIADAVVLDLFAGSGALGLEAVSRGAKFAVVNDVSRQAHCVIEGNVKKLGFQDRVTLYCLDYTTAIKRASASGLKFDIVFLDPPYNSGLIQQSMQILRDMHALNKGFVIAAEHRTKESFESPSGFSLVDKRNYAGAAISFFREDE